MTSLTAPGTISYNGFTFAGPRVNSSVSIQPVRDRADRNVTHGIYTITVHAIVTSDTAGQGGGTADPLNHIKDMEWRLTEDGGQLRYNGLGHGNIEANTSNANRDCSYGPKTQSLSVKQIGSLFVHEVDWVVRTSIKRCGTSDTITGVIGNFKSFLYSVNWSADSQGLVTRRISGFYKIVLNRAIVGGVRITRTAEDSRDRLTVVVPDRFQRISSDWTLSEDKSQMDFSIVDRELESDNAYPEGVAEANMTHSLSIQGIVGVKQNGSIVGSITMARPFPVALGWSRMLLMIRERITHAQRFGMTIYTNFSVTEEVFKRRLSFDIRYKYYLKEGFKKTAYGKAVGNHGLFNPIQSTSFAAWSRSMQSTAWHNRGTSRLRHRASSDRLVSVCDRPGALRISEWHLSR